MAAIECLTDHNAGVESCIDNIRVSMDFDNNDDYMIGIQNAFLFDGDGSRSTPPGNLYPADPLSYNANDNNSSNNTANSGKLIDNPNIKDNNHRGIHEYEDESVESNYQTAGHGQHAQTGLWSPESQPRLTRQTKKKTVSQKTGDTAPPSKSAPKKKEPKTRRQPKRESATKVNASTDTGAGGASNNNKKSNRRDKSLERNRVAASKCRKRKKQWTDNLETKKSGLEAHNRNLQVQYNGLVDEASQLKNLIIAHAGCNDANIDVWIENEAIKYVRKLSNPQEMEQQGRNFQESMSHLQESLLRQHSSSTQITEPSQDTISPYIDAEADDVGTEESLPSDVEDEIEVKGAEYDST